jgi:NAD(P)-dependent dehydrogenase (short-subunit alcohol dehydrogenase family)
MTVTDIRPLVLVTGPTRGLGKALVLALARRKIRLLLLGRDDSALKQVADAARSAGASRTEIAVLDLASFSSIRAAAGQVAELVRQHDLGVISAVVANAGIQMGDRVHTTTDGLETTFGVNVVGNQMLLSLLKPLLAIDAHVVVVGSGTHFGDPLTRLVIAAPHWEDPKQLALPVGADLDTPKAGQCAYSTSKLGVNYLVHELNRRWGAPIRANIYDPGLMPGTGLARDLPPLKQWAWNNIMPALKVFPGVSSTTNSAERLARLVLGEEHASTSNAYIEIGKLTAASDASNDPGREKALWEYCERITSNSTERTSR